ncbi:MAG: hypothetical protein Q8R70_13115 [Methanoregula sp.]|nr:hypothetical protein [Methanoregula sp.]
MFAKFLHRITKKIRRSGYTKDCAWALVRFLVTGRIIFAILRGMMRARQNKTCDPMNGVSTGYCGQVAAAEYYPPFGIHR